MDSEDEIDLLDNEQACKAIRIGIPRESLRSIEPPKLEKHNSPSGGGYFRKRETDFLKGNDAQIHFTDVKKIAEKLGIYEKNTKKSKHRNEEDTFMDFDMSQPIRKSPKVHSAKTK